MPHRGTLDILFGMLAIVHGCVALYGIKVYSFVRQWETSAPSCASFAKGTQIGWLEVWGLETQIPR